MTAPIEDVSSLPGREVLDQETHTIGEVKAIYATEDGFPMWIAVEVGSSEAGTGASDNGESATGGSDNVEPDAEMVFIPLARLKEERDGDLCVQYSVQHILDAPRPDDEQRISAECDREMRIYYGLGLADQEMWEDNQGYVTLVPQEFGEAERVEDPDDLETPDADKRSEESMKRLHEPRSSSVRDVSAEDIYEESDEETDQDDDEKDAA